MMISKDWMPRLRAWRTLHRQHARDERGAVTAFVIILTSTLLAAGLLTAQLSIIYSDYSTARQFAQAAARNAVTLADDSTRETGSTGLANFNNPAVLAEARTNALGYLEFQAFGPIPANATWCGRSNAPKPVCGANSIVAAGSDPGTVVVTVTYQSRSILPGLTLGQFTASAQATQRFTDTPIA